MNKIVIASHSTLSEGLLSSAKLITGETKNVSCIAAYKDNSIDYEKMIENAVSEFDYTNGELIVVTDILGGSVNNEFCKYIEKYPFHLIAGANLVTVISLIINLNTINQKKIKEIVEESRESIVYCNEAISENTNNDF